MAWSLTSEKTQYSSSFSILHDFEFSWFLMVNLCFMQSTTTPLKSPAMPRSQRAFDLLLPNKCFYL